MGDRVLKCVCEILGTQISELNASMSLSEELGMDSLDAVELVMCLEDEFGVEIADEDFEHVVTIGDIYKLEALRGKL